MEVEMTKTNLSNEKYPGKIITIKKRITEPEALEDTGTYKAVFESAGDIMLLIDSAGKILDINKRLTEIGGYGKEEFIGKNIRTLPGIMPKKSMVKITGKFRKRMAGSNVRPYEVELFTKKGESSTFEVSARPFKKAGKLIGDLVILRDVTERKQLEEALKASEENFRDILDNSAMGIRIRNQGGDIWYSNPAFLDIFGYENNEEAIASPPQEHYTREGHDEYLHRKEKSSRGELIPDKFEVDIVRKDGTQRHVQVFGREVLKSGKRQFETFYNDITERKLIEDALKASEQNFRNSMDSSFMGIYIVDTDRHIHYANQAFMDMFGYENIEEVRISPPQQHYTPESYAEFLDRKERFKGGESVRDMLEVDIVRKDGTIRHLEVFRRELNWDGKQQHQILYNDVTEHKQIENALRASEQNFRNSIASSSMGIRVGDIGEQTLYVNQAFLDIFGYKNIDEVSASPPSEYYTPESYADSVFRKDKLLRGETIPDQIEVDIVRKDGMIRHLQISRRDIFWNGKQESQIIYHDITERKQMEEALKASEQNFRNSIASSSMGIRITDKDDNTLYANQAFLDIFQYKNIEEIKAFSSIDSYTPEEYARYLLRKEKRARGEPTPDSFEVDISRKDGTIRHLQIFRDDIIWDGEMRFQNFYNDITERRQMEEALKASEQNFRNSLDTSSMGIYIVDAEFNTSYANQVFLDIFGYENIDEVRKVPPHDYFTPESHAYFLLRREQESRGEPTLDKFEVNIMRKDGTIRHLQVSRKEIYWDNKHQSQVIYNDITQRVQAEKQLEQVAQEWKTTFDSITDLISIHDKDNRILRVNKAVADLLKTTPQQLIGKFCHEVMHGTNEPPAYCPNRLTLKTGKPAAIENYNPNFEAYFHESTSPIFNDKGEVTGSVNVVRDITQQKRIEEQLIMTDRLASIGELSSGVAHELNNPLTSVIGFSQLLMEGDAPANIKEDLAIIYNEAQRAAVIVKNLLTFARKHAPVKQLSQVNMVIEDVLRLRAYEQKVNNIEVEYHLGTNLPEIMMDHFQMQQVFLNVIVNAESAMLEAHHRGKLIITTEKIDSIIKVTFTDDGPGITKENLKRIFDPFFTTKEVGKGTGLGLSICHGIVTEHSGKIYARSENGHGASFVVELPLNGQ
jgi:PAS domain S-box-containing protein